MKTTTTFKEITKFERDLALCMKCGFCTFWCPVYQEERLESSVARGKEMMVRALVDGKLAYSNEFIKRLNKCTLCMGCVVNCPARVQIPSVIVAARADSMESNGMPWLPHILYRWLLPRRRLFGNVVRFVSWLQAVFMLRSEGTIRHLPLFLSALGKGRNIPQIAPKFLRQLVPVVNMPPPESETRMKVGYFTGCMTDFVFPDLGKRLITFLNKNGVEVVVPREQGCCGAPVFLGAGDFETGRKLADRNAEVFTAFDYVVTDCATCGSAIKDYVKFLANTPQRDKSYRKLANKIVDITGFLVNVLKLPPSAYHASPDIKGKKVTWHDPCHLSRHMGIKEQPRQILRSIPDIQYIEMADADRCCGMAGAFNLYFYDLSQKIVDKKMKNIGSVEADIVVTGCPGCEVQLIDGAIRNRMTTKVMHIIELLG